MERTSDKLPIKRRMVILLILNNISLSFMFSRCLGLGALDSNGMGDFIDHEHEILPQLNLEISKILMTNYYNFPLQSAIFSNTYPP